MRNYIFCVVFSKSSSVNLSLELLYISHVLILLAVHEFRYTSYLKRFV